MPGGSGGHPITTDRRFYVTKVASEHETRDSGKILDAKDGRPRHSGPAARHGL